MDSQKGTSAMPDSDAVLRPSSLTDSLAERILRSVTEAGEGASGTVLSERRLAEVHGVSRTTVRRALHKLTEAGWLSSLPRRGYRVTAPAPGAGPGAGSAPVAVVRSRVGRPAEWTRFQARLVGAVQAAAAAAGRDVLLVGREGTEPAGLARQLLSQGVGGALVDCDEPAFAAAMRRAGLPALLIDAAGEGVESVTQDNFGGALAATRHLIERGHRRIGCVTYEAVPGWGLVHTEERLGGYLAAMSRAGSPAAPEWVIACPAESSPGEALVRLCRGADGPTAAVILWSEVLDEVTAAFSAARLNVELCVWWGGTPGLRDGWASRHRGVPLPAGVAWDVASLAGLALKRLAEIARDPELVPARTLVPLRLVPGEEAKS
jgi:LacI family transcriptional regulator